MKIVMLMALLVLVVCFGGCTATDTAYGASKEVYGVGKTAYKVSGVKSQTLENIDSVAVKYDSARSTVRGLQEPKKQDANTSKALAK